MINKVMDSLSSPESNESFNYDLNNEYVINQGLLDNKINKKKKIKLNNHYKVFLKFMLHILIHISLLSVLEPVFFFKYASEIESKIFINEMEKYISFNNNMVQDFITSLSKSDKMLYNELTILYNKDYTVINDYLNNLDHLQKEAILNNYDGNMQLENKAYRFTIITSSITAFILLVLYYKVEINILYLILEHVVLIFFICLYEFWFFNNVIFKYQPLAIEQINYYFSSCIINNINKYILSKVNNINNTITCIRP